MSLQPAPVSFLERMRDTVPILRFKQMAKASFGMLPARMYLRYYREVLKLPDHDIIEIGGGGGAGSVAMGWALKEAGRKGRVVVVEKCEGGSRSRRGDYSSNVERFEENLHFHGVADHVKLFPHYLSEENAGEVLALVQTDQIAGLVHDADGLVHRDFLLFWDRLIDNGLIIVDDFEPILRATKSKDGQTKHNYKKLLTYCIVSKLIEWGLFEPTFYRNNTLFGRKPVGGDLKRLDRGLCEELELNSKTLCQTMNQSELRA